MSTIEWSSISSNLVSKDYICGHCGADICSKSGYSGIYREQRGRQGLVINAYIYICHRCSFPTFFFNDYQSPGPTFGKEIDNLPDDISNLYREARLCISVQAFTASVLASRKLLMNIAVSKGAEEGLKFIQYVQYLADKGYTPPNSKEWVDHIRKRGNDATHEIALMDQETAELLIKFIEMILKFIFEFPGIMQSKKS